MHYKLKLRPTIIPFFFVDSFNVLVIFIMRSNQYLFSKFEPEIID